MCSKKPKSLKEALNDKLSPEKLKLVPRSWDIVGDIAILDIPIQLDDEKELIGNTLLNTFKPIRVVVNKLSEVKTEYRTRKFEIIAGEDRTETIYREYECRYKLDIEGAYFSPRLGTERIRIANQVKADERVLVMFAGIGFYPVLIAKKSNAEVYGIELNPVAFGYMEENIRLNKVSVTPIQGDVRKKTSDLGKFDRVVMPLPKDAENFLDISLPALKDDGIIHFYDFARNGEETAKKVEKICLELGYETKILDVVRCGSYSPALSRFCTDFRIYRPI